MNARSLALLALFAGGAAALAMFSGRDGGSTSAQAATDTVLLPELASNLNDVRSVRVESSEGTFTLALKDDTWGMVEKAHYPIDESKVRKLLFALRDAEILEEKTSKPEFYEKLGVQGLEGDESPSVHVTVERDGGAKLASLIVGNRRVAQGRADEAYYARRADEAQSLLVEADLRIDKADAAWLDKEIVDLPRDRVRAIEIVHADGERVFVHKDDEDATDYELAAIPEGKELRYAGAPASLASGLTRLQMDDVRAAGDTTLPDAPLAVASFWTYDGMKVVTTVYEAEEDKLLAKVEAAYDEVGPPIEMMGPAVPIDIEGAADEGESEEPAAEARKTPEEVQAEASALTDKAAPWIYVLPSWKKSTLAKRADELLKDIEPPAEPEAGAEGDLLNPGAVLENEMPPEEDDAGHDHR